MTHSKKPIIVVGAGLAGLCVALRLIEKNQAVIVYDNGVNHSSAVAAGMINPLVFRRMTKSWRVDEFMAELLSFYKGLEAQTGMSFFHPITIRRMFSTENERQLWLKKQALPEFEKYMEILSEEDDQFDKVHNNFGSGRVKQSSYVETDSFLKAAKSLVSKYGEIRNEPFHYGLLEENLYKGEAFSSLVFCEGYMGKSNPLFGYLPLQQTKGETLTIRSERLPENESVNRKCFVLPLGNQSFKIGSTYVWNTPSVETTSEGREEILENLSYLTTESVEIIDQKAGVRPTVLDRRPLMGRHPERSNLYVMNGLGAKGYMLAPLLSQSLVDLILNDLPLDSEVEIQRYADKYTN